jgi:hypothetical protein
MEWDSRFFKMPIGCIEYALVGKNLHQDMADKILSGLLLKTAELAVRLNIRLLYISPESTQHSLIRAAGSGGFNFICGQMLRAVRRADFSRLSANGKTDGNCEFRRYRKSDYSSLIEIAKEIGQDVESKYSLTPYLDNKLKAGYYLESIKNCCRGLNADEIFVALRKNTVMGFICYKHDRAFQAASGKRMSYLIMAGISRLARGKNFAASLINWAHRQVFKQSSVLLGRTYLHNQPMIRFILKREVAADAGFTFTFCKRL